MSEDVEEGRKGEETGARIRRGGVGMSGEVDMVVVSDSLTAPQFKQVHITLQVYRVMYMSVCFRVMTEGGTSPSGWV